MLGLVSGWYPYLVLGLHLTEILMLKITLRFLLGKSFSPEGLTNKGPYWSEKESSLNLGLPPREA